MWYYRFLDCFHVAYFLVSIASALNVVLSPEVIQLNGCDCFNSLCFECGIILEEFESIDWRVFQ